MSVNLLKYSEHIAKSQYICSIKVVAYLFIFLNSLFFANSTFSFFHHQLSRYSS